MKKHLRNSLGLMAVSVIGISLFMALWIWGSFADEQRSLAETSTHTLSEALQAYTQRLVKTGSFSAIPVDSIRLPRDSGWLFPGHTRAFAHPRTKPSGFMRMIHPSFNASTLRATRTLTPVLFAEPLEKWVSVKRLKSVIAALLREQKIGLDFSLDTVRISEKKWLEDGQPPMDNRPHWPGFYRDQPSNLLPGGMISSRPLPFNMEKKLFLRLTFYRPFWYILAALKWQLITVTILISLTAGCFSYMVYQLIRQKKLADMKNDFINNMTHELKTPVATVSAAVEALTGFGALDDKKKTDLYLKISRRELDHLSGLIEKVMDLAIYGHDNLVLNYKPVLTTELLHKIAGRYRQMTVKPVTLSLYCKSNMPHVLLDPLHMRNAISNLIDNAIKYSGERVDIRIESDVVQEQLEISISDNGIGIEAKYHPHIFERFFRVPTGNVHTVKGYGLGLAYVKQVVLLHRGHISLHSQPGIGSTFKISIPIK